MLLLHVGAQTRVVSWSPRGSGTTTTLLASPRYAYSSSPLQGLSYSCTYGLIWFHLCLFIFRKIYKPLDLLVFQLLVKVGSFVAWPGFCTYEKTAIAAEYSKLLGLEEVEAFLTAGATAYLRLYVHLKLCKTDANFNFQAGRSKCISYKLYDDK
jgi:hypothetical protein